MKTFQDRIDLILEEILGSNEIPRTRHESWKKYYREKILEALREFLSLELEKLKN